MAKMPDIIGHHCKRRMQGATARAFFRFRQWVDRYPPVTLDYKVVAEEILFWPDPCEATAAAEVLADE